MEPIAYQAWAMRHHHQRRWFLLVETDVLLNDLADKYAKRAVEAHRVPFRIRKVIEDHNQLTHDNAAWIARATILANQQQHEPHRDTQASRAKASEAAAIKRKTKRDGNTQQQTPHVNVAPPTPLAEPTMGHTLQTIDVGWWCTTCTLKSATKTGITARKCKGPAVINWKAKAKTKPAPTGGKFRQHVTVESGTLHWCVTRGAFC